MSRRKYEPKIRVWKLKDKDYAEQYQQAVLSRRDEMDQAIGVNNKWNAMKKILTDVAEEVLGKTRGPPKHKETWWWNKDVADAVEEKKTAFKKWRDTRVNADYEAYKEQNRNARKAVTKTKEEKGNSAGPNR